MIKMNEDIKELLKELQDSVDYPKVIVPTYDGSDEEEMDNDICFTPNKCKVLLNYIGQLQNNWNELKKWLEEELEILKSRNCYDRKNLIIVIETVLNKMQELEQGKDE